jgi:uncharacterized membrane protein YGL010W
MIVRLQENRMPTLTDSAAAAASPRKVDQLLAHYGESHRNPRNETIHFVAIPLIMLSLVGLLYALHPWVAFAFLLAMALVSLAVLGLVMAMGERVLPISIAIFVGAWIAQFVGHRIEGRKPSFFEDLQYLWVGPIFVLSKLFLKLGIRW